MARRASKAAGIPLLGPEGLAALAYAGLSVRYPKAEWPQIAVLRGKHAIWVGPADRGLEPFWASAAWKAHQAGERRVPPAHGKGVSKPVSDATREGQRRKASQDSA